MNVQVKHEVDGKFYEIDAEVTGRYHPATMEQPAEGPEVDLLTVVEIDADSNFLREVPYQEFAQLVGPAGLSAVDEKALVLAQELSDYWDADADYDDADDFGD